MGGNEADATTSLLINGSLDTFDSVTTDPSSGTWHIHAVGTGASTNGFRSNEIDTTIGKSYRCSFDIKVISGTVMMIGADTSAFNNDIYWSATSTDAAWTRYNYDFTASAIYAYFQFRGIAEWYVDNVSIVQIGAVAEYDGSGVASDKWFDKSGNDLHGTISGTTVENAPAGEDDGLVYETGTWDAVLSDGTREMAMHPTYKTGDYTRIGNIVHVSGDFATTDLDGGSGDATGAIRITGLPFTSANDVGVYSGGGAALGVGLDITAGESVSYYVAKNITYINLYIWNAATGTAAMTATEWSDNGEIILSFSYKVA